MAKKKTAAGAFLTCAGYDLTVRNSDTSLIFELDVTDTNGDAFQLRVKTPNDPATGVVQDVLALLGHRWPAFVFEFKADADGNITEVKSGA
jgi:hypothetical protein